MERTRSDARATQKMRESEGADVRGGAPKAGDSEREKANDKDEEEKEKRANEGESRTIFSQPAPMNCH